MDGNLADSVDAEGERLGRELLGNMTGLRLQLARVTRDPELASDLLQDAIVTALQKLRAGELTSREHLDGYVYRIALNHLRNYRRKDKTPVSDHEAAQELEDTAGQSLPEALGSVQCARVARKLLEEIKSPRDRDLLVRFYLNEEDKESLCHEFGLTEAHFNRVIFRARERFRGLLEDRGLNKADLLSMVLMLQSAATAEGLWTVHR
jgi:RNA polymerase sigma-70 factor (ECF subfamily)